MNWEEIWNSIVNFFNTNIWNIVIFFAVLILGIIVVKILLNVTKRILNKTRMEKITVGFLCAILKILLYLALILILLSIIGVEISGVLTALSALLLAVGLALQNIIANAANGIVIVSNKMFKKGDYVKVNGHEGKVVSINFLFTTLLTGDNKRITIPNSAIVNGPVVDYDASKTRRVDLKFTVAYESDVEEVKKLILDCMNSNGKILLEPAPFCRLSGLGASSIEFTAKCWCDSEDYWDVYYDLLELVYNEMKRKNISIPYDQIEIRERKDEVILPVNGKGIPKRVEKVRTKTKSIDLENVDFAEIFNKKNKKSKDKKKDKKKKQTKKDKKDKNNNKTKDVEKVEEVVVKEDLTKVEETPAVDKRPKKNNKSKKQEEVK